MSRRESPVCDRGAGGGLEGEGTVADGTARHDPGLSEKDVEAIAELMLKKLKEKGPPPVPTPGSLPEEGRHTQTVMYTARTHTHTHTHIYTPLKAQVVAPVRKGPKGSS